MHSPSLHRTGQLRHKACPRAGHDGRENRCRDSTRPDRTLAMDLFLQQIANGLVIGSTYAVVAIGFSLAFTVLRVINFAHPDTFMVGMFAGLTAGRLVSDNLIVVLVGGALGSGAVGLVLERAVIRPLRGRDV